MLPYLEDTDIARYRALIERLGLRRAGQLEADPFRGGPPSSGPKTKQEDQPQSAFAVLGSDPREPHRLRPRRGRSESMTGAGQKPCTDVTGLTGWHS